MHGTGLECGGHELHCSCPEQYEYVLSGHASCRAGSEQNVPAPQSCWEAEPLGQYMPSSQPWEKVLLGQKDPASQYPSATAST